MKANLGDKILIHKCEEIVQLVGKEFAVAYIDVDGAVYIEPIKSSNLMIRAQDFTVVASFMEAAGLDTSDPNVKDSNPKDAIGCSKPSTHFIPRPVLYEVGNALLFGAGNYGAFNWRIAGVRASTYQNAAGRHIDAWQEGEENAPDSGIHHLSHAIAGLMIIRDAIICDKFIDDRPPSAPADWMEKARAQTAAIIEGQTNPVEPYTQKRVEEENLG